MTPTVSPTGVCSTARDSEGRYPLYKYNATNGTTHTSRTPPLHSLSSTLPLSLSLPFRFSLPLAQTGCAGLNYASFAADGSDLDPMTAYCYDATYYVISNLCAHSDYTTYSVPRQLLDNGYSAMNLVVDGYGTTAGVTGALNLSYGMVGAGDYQVPGTVACGPRSVRDV